MTIIRTTVNLTRYDVSRIKRARYEILAIETHHLEPGDTTELLWSREDPPDAIQAHEIPF